MKPIAYLVVDFIIFVCGLYAAFVHGSSLGWLVVVVSVIAGVGIGAKLGLTSEQLHKMSWRRTFLHGRIRPEIHRHS